MKRSIWQRLDVMTRRSTPVMLTLILVVLNQVPFHIPWFAEVMPLLPLIAIYHWTVYRADLLPPYAVFIVGILQDLLTGAPLGLHAVVYLGVYGTVLSQQGFFSCRAFFTVWLGFGLIAAAASAAGWVLVSAWNVALLEARAVFYQYLLTVGVFPLVAWVFLRWQRSVLRQA